MKFTKKQVWQIIGVCALVALMITGLVLGLVFGLKNKAESPQEIQPQESSPLVIETIEENGIMLTSSEAITASDGTTSQTVTATVTPSYADATLQWSLAFKNPSSTWAKDKSVDSYMTIVVSNDTTYCTVQCNEAFGEQIILKATSIVNSSATASCTIDYEKRIQDFSIEIREKTAGIVSAIAFSDEELQYTFTPTLTLGVGTIEPTPTYTYQFTDEFNSALTGISATLIGFVPNTTVTDINSKLTFSVPNFSGNPPFVGYGTYQFSSSFNQMLNNNPSQAMSYASTVASSVKKAIKAYNGNVLKFTCSYTSSNGNGVTVSKVKEIPIGTCNFPSLEASSASLDKTTMVF